MTGNLHRSPISGLGRALVGLIAVVLVLGASAASAQEDPYNPDPPEISLSDSEVCRGDVVVVTVSGVDPGESIAVTFAGQSTSITAGNSGTASTSFGTSSTAPGTHTVQATTGAGSASASVTVDDGEACAPSTPAVLSIADPRICAGEAAVATVTGAPGQSTTITLAGQSTVVTIGAAGTASTSFSTSRLAPGEYSIVAASDGASSSAPLVILGPDAEECRPDTPDRRLGISAADTCADEPVVVTVTGAAGAEAVTVSLGGATANVTTGPDGSAQTAIAPNGLSVGTHDLLATSVSGGGASTQVTLLGAADGCTGVLGRGDGVTRPRSGVLSTGRGGGSVAITGAYTWPLVGAGVLLVAAGGVLTWRSRRTKVS